MAWVRFVLLGLLIGCTSLFSLAAPPNIVLITLDTTRADRMGFLGSHRGLTPNLDALARQSEVFTRAYSQVPLTTASHATILTGTYPQFHKVNDAGVPLAKDLPFAAALLRQHGYHTAAFVGSVILDPKAGAPGFDRGFDTYDASFRSRQSGEDRYKTLERRGSEVVAHATAWIAKHPQGPFFVWIHLYDPHAPYDPPEPFKSRYKADPYNGEIAYADSVVGKFLETLRARSLYDRTLIAIAADHGEALGEHGERGHGIFLYDPTIHVPLLFKLPVEHASGKRSDVRVGLVDVLPTLLETAGISIPKEVQGKPLLTSAAEDKKKDSDRPAYAETDYPHRAYGWSSLRSLRSGKYLFIEAPRNELYDQTADADAEHDLASSAGAVTGTLAAQLDQFRRDTSSSRVANAQLSPEQAQRLHALGYVTSNDNGKTSSKVGGIDPKDKIEVANLMTAAVFAEEENRHEEAVTILQKVVAKDPSLAPAYTQLGEIWTSVGDLGHAVPALRKAVELKPESVSARYGLGLALFDSGDLRGAAREFEAAVAGNPGSADMHYSLASVYVRINRMDDAKKQLERSLALKPGFFDANLMLGQVFVVEKKPVQALPFLQKAASLQPNRPEPHLQLADVYGQLGKKQDAERERALAGRR